VRDVDVSGLYPIIGEDVLYLLCLALSLSVGTLSVVFLVRSLRKGDREGAWVSAAFVGAASLIAAFSFWYLALE
jgi:hypothetical protein